MESKIESVREHYTTNLKAEAYFKEMTETYLESKNSFVFIMQSISDVIKSGRFSGTKLLELSSGPTVHNVAIPSAQFTNVVQSDLVPDNCAELRKWLRGESVIDWSPFLDMAAEIAGYSDLEKGRSELESRIRHSVKRVVHCDVLSETILPLQELTDPETSAPYDLIITTLAMAASAVDYDSYKKALRGIHGLLRTGGGLIICDFENGAPWPVGDVIFNHIQLSIQQVTAALQAAGFGNLEYKVMRTKGTNADYDSDSIFCMAAEKL